MLGAKCEVTDTLAEKHLQPIEWGSVDHGEWLESWSHKCMSGRRVHGCWQTHHKKWLRSFDSISDILDTFVLDGPESDQSLDRPQPSPRNTDRLHGTRHSGCPMARRERHCSRVSRCQNVDSQNVRDPSWQPARSCPESNDRSKADAVAGDSRTSGHIFDVVNPTCCSWSQEHYREP